MKGSFQFAFLRLLSPRVGRGVRRPEDDPIWSVAHGPLAARWQARYPLKPPYPPKNPTSIWEGNILGIHHDRVPVGAIIPVELGATILGIPVLGPASGE